MAKPLLSCGNASWLDRRRRRRQRVARTKAVSSGKAGPILPLILHTGTLTTAVVRCKL